MSAPSILDPFTFPRTGHVVRNRSVLAAMTNKQSHEDGSLGDDELHWLAARAKGGFGIVTTCAAHVALDGQGWAGELGVYDDALLPGLTRLADAIREGGALSLVQIFHAGVRAPSKLTGRQPWSASQFQLEARGFEEPRAATTDDIERAIGQFADAARRSAAAGMDGVEIHGAHGYLISQFLGTVTNTRDDEWGGSLDNRARFVRRIVAAVRDVTPDDFLVGVRLSPEIEQQGIVLDEALQTAQWLRDDGVDFLHVSNWDSFRPPAAHPDSDRMLTSWFREAVGDEVPVIATGGVWTREQADQVLSHGADLIGVGRAAIGNASWADDIADPSWEPPRPPYTADHLRAAALGESMIGYMRNWPDFVVEGS